MAKTTFSSTIQLDDIDCLDPRVEYSECRRLGLSLEWYGKPNAYHLPRGRNPGRGFVLMLKKDLDTLDLNSTSHKLSFFYGDVKRDITGLVIIHADTVIGSRKEDDVNASYLVELADARWLGQYTVVDRSYNVQSTTNVTSGAADLYDASLNSGSEWTWDTMLSNLWGNLPSSAFGAYPGSSNLTLPTQMNPRDYEFWGCNAWDAICKVLDDINAFVTVEFTAAGVAEFVLRNVGTSRPDITTVLSDAADNAARLIHRKEGTAAAVPENIDVFFPSIDMGWQKEATDTLQITAKTYWRNRPLYKVTVASSAILSGVTAIAGTRVGIHDSMLALYPSTGSGPSNSSALTTRATDIATQYAQGLNLGGDPVDMGVYHGIHLVEPGSDVARVSWYDMGDSAGMVTDVVPGELGASGSFLASRDRGRAARPFTPSEIGIHTRRFPGPPDLGTKHQPFEHIAFFKLSGSLSAFGTATAVPLYDGSGANIDWQEDVHSSGISIYEGTGTSYTSGEVVVCVWSEQANKWIATNHTSGYVDGSTYKFYADADDGPAQTITNNDTLWIKSAQTGSPATDGIDTLAVNTDEIHISHHDTSALHGAANADATDGLRSITVDTMGHVTAWDVQTVCKVQLSATSDCEYFNDHCADLSNAYTVNEDLRIHYDPIRIDASESCRWFIDAHLILGYDIDKIQILGHAGGGAAAAPIKWYDVEQC